MMFSTAIVATAALALTASAQTFHRSASCPTNGCVYPPDQADFIAGQAFDIRVEAQQPVNGSTPWRGAKTLDKVEIKDSRGTYISLEDFFHMPVPVSESYNFTYFEDLQSRDAKTPTLVNVVAKTYRNLALYTPGNYTVLLTYNGGLRTFANWVVVDLAKAREAHNVIVFIGDGMTTSMITAARLLGHKAINGKYVSKMAMDTSEAYGAQMTHSLDSFITDSANSASSLAGGKKMTVNALNVYTDSSESTLANPKVETIYEMFRRIYRGKVGVVSTAIIADATPAAVVAHTSRRGEFVSIIGQFLDGVSGMFPWAKWDGVDVLFGGGAELFLPSTDNNQTDVYGVWAARDYNIVHNRTDLIKMSNSSRALGMFNQGNTPTWLDRNVFKSNLNQTKSWDGKAGAYDVPGLKEMTLQAINILTYRAIADGDTGFMLMSEAASIDKQMHAMDYDRALGELLEFDDTIKATLQHLKDIGEYERTLVIVTADHGHGFDVYGSADTKYLKEQSTDRTKRESIGTYEKSGLSGYQVPNNGTLPDNSTIFIGPQGLNFPVTWQPRYTIAAGVVAHSDMRENFQVGIEGIREPAAPLVNGSRSNQYAKPASKPDGFLVNGTLPISSSSGVHSLTDVPVFAWGPASSLFRGHYDSVDIALKIAQALKLGRSSNITLPSSSKAVRTKAKVGLSVNL